MRRPLRPRRRPPTRRSTRWPSHPQPASVPQSHHLHLKGGGLVSDFDAIDSLLASVGPQAELPAPEVRRDLREQAGLSKAQVARTLGVSPSTVTGWEGGRDPVGGVRTKYAYLLDGLSAKLTTETGTK